MNNKRRTFVRRNWRENKISAQFKYHLLVEIIKNYLQEDT